MARIGLAEIPGPGRELEDYVAGLFQAAGYFVERGIHERAFTDVLELDVVATRYDGDIPTSVLVEAKGGHWGFPDLFKVVGWMQYLQIELAGFFIARDNRPRNVPRVHEKVAPLGISLVDLADFRDSHRRFEAAGFGAITDVFLPDLWRYSFWVERVLLDRLRGLKRSLPRAAGPAAVLGYHDLIHDHVFFIKERSERLALLYKGYRDHPKLSLALAIELGGEAFEPLSRASSSKILGEAMCAGKHAPVQASFYVEHRGRLSILKAAIDLLCHDNLTPTHRLPETFREGMRILRTRPNFRRYALVWQVFLWGFGGFFLADRVDQEFSWLSAQTGVPFDEVRLALRAFDDLFPTPSGSWLAPLRGTNIVAAKMVPTAFRGIGSMQRLKRYKANNYRDLGYQDATSRHLVDWHNNTVALLAA
jgi:hypothetical protein